MSTNISFIICLRTAVKIDRRHFITLHCSTEQNDKKQRCLDCRGAIHVIQPDDHVQQGTDEKGCQLTGYATERVSVSTGPNFQMRLVRVRLEATLCCHLTAHQSTNNLLDKFCSGSTSKHCTDNDQDGKRPVSSTPITRFKCYVFDTVDNNSTRASHLWC